MYCLYLKHYYSNETYQHLKHILHKEAFFIFAFTNKVVYIIEKSFNMQNLECFWDHH